MVTADMAAPEGFELETSGDTLRIAWRGPSHWICLVGGAFVMVLAGSLLATFVLTSPEALGAAVAFAAATLVSAYVLLIGLCNRTVVEASQNRLTVRHGPIPCPLSRVFQLPCTKTLPSKEIDEVYLEEETRRNVEGEAYHVYGLHARTKHAASEQLLTGLSLDEATFLKSELGQILPK